MGLRWHGDRGVDQSDKDYNHCIVQLPDRPRQPNGQPAATFALHRNLTTMIQQCRELGAAPAAIPGGVSHPGPTSEASLWNSIVGFAENGLAILGRQIQLLNDAFKAPEAQRMSPVLVGH